MVLGRKAKDAVEAKVHRMLKKFEDVEATTELKYERFIEAVKKIDQGLVAVVTARNTLQNSKKKLLDEIVKIDNQISSTTDETLKQKLEMRKGRTNELISKTDQHILAVESRIEAMKKQKMELEFNMTEIATTMKAACALFRSSKASMIAMEQVGGVSGNDLIKQIEELNSRTEHMLARSDAIGELIEDGTLGGTV